MLVDVMSVSGTTSSTIELDDYVFGISPNMPVIHKAIVTYLANQRQGTRSALTRAEVRGGGKKPWRQKGTGHARQGSIRAPQWTHGGIVFPAKPKEYRKTLSKKTRQLAIRSSLSLKRQENALVIIDSLSMNSYNTKYIVNALNKLNTESPLIVLGEGNDFVVKSGRNIPGVLVTSVDSLNTYDIFYHKSLIICQSAIEKIHEYFGQKDIQKVVA